jgi:hypothetical protein
MAFIPKPNTGTLWPNKFKNSASHPDKKGDLVLSRSFLKDMMSKSDDDLIKISIAGWERDINGQDCLSISASEPYVKKEESKPAKQEEPDEDVPF